MNTYASEALTAQHDVSTFSCGENSLDHWLRRYALANQLVGSSRTFVVTAYGKVVGYYSLSVAVVEHEDAPPAVAEGMPPAYSIPAVLLARLAVDSKHQGQGWGHVLVADAAVRALAIAEQAGVRVLLVHALNDQARRFYESVDFTPSPTNDRHLMITMADIAASMPTDGTV